MSQTDSVRARHYILTLLRLTLYRLGQVVEAFQLAQVRQLTRLRISAGCYSPQSTAVIVAVIVRTRSSSSASSLCRAGCLTGSVPRRFSSRCRRQSKK